MKRFIRRAIIGTAQLLVLPLALWWWITGKKAQVFGSCFDLIAWLPGTTGSILRVALLKWMARRCDEQVRVEMGTLFSDPRVSLGYHVYIGDYCILGWAEIEDYVLIASRVSIPSGQHVHHFDRTDIPIALQGGTKTPVRIGRGSWIGEGAIIMADVGEECVIGAGAVVTKPIPPWSIAVGVPARVIRSRKHSGEETGCQPYESEP